MMYPVCLAGASFWMENLDSLAARIANERRHASSVEACSSTLAAVTAPEGLTVMMTFTSPPPLQRYAGMGR